MLLRTLCFLLLFSPALSAYTIETDRAIVQKAALWAPADLRPLFKIYSRDFWHGFDSARRTPPLSDKALLNLTDRLIEGFDREAPMEANIRMWGRLSAEVLKLSDPTRTAPQARRYPRIVGEFPRLVRSKMHRIPVIFYGLDKSFFNGGRTIYLKRWREREAEWFHLLLLDYRHLGSRQDYRAFDDRSNAFGVVSLSLNYGFTALLNFWYHIWRQAGGRWGPLTPTYAPDKLLVVAHGY